MEPLNLKHEDSSWVNEAKCTNNDVETADVFKTPKAEPEAVFVSGYPSYLALPLANVKTELQTLEDDEILNKSDAMEPKIKLTSNETCSTYPHFDHVEVHVKVEDDETMSENAVDNKFKIKNEEGYACIKQENVTSSENSCSPKRFRRRKKQKKTTRTQSSNDPLPDKPKRVKVYKCPYCSFQTTHERNMKVHIHWHGNSQDKYKCAYCSFQTLWKSAYKRHSLRHMDPEEVKMYKCTDCDFQTLQKNHLDIHMLRHKTPKESSMYKCPQCDFQTLWKSYLKRHFLRHVNPEKLDMFKCFDCDYETFDKSYLKKHVLRHRDPKDLDIYKCTECSYQTINKGNLKLHVLRHRNRENPGELIWYKCSECDYQTIHKSNLKVHILRHHGNPQDADSYKCYECTHQTLPKGRLDTHAYKKDERGMYKCSDCGYKSLRKNNLKVHILRHHGKPKNASTDKCVACDCQRFWEGSFSENLQDDTFSETLHNASLKLET